MLQSITSFHYLVTSRPNPVCVLSRVVLLPAQPINNMLSYCVILNHRGDSNSPKAGMGRRGYNEKRPS